MQKILALGLTLLGLMLVAYMVVVESEPGAVPLLMVLLGIGWLVSVRFRKAPKPGGARRP